MAYGSIGSYATKAASWLFGNVDKLATAYSMYDMYETSQRMKDFKPESLTPPTPDPAALDRIDLEAKAKFAEAKKKQQQVAANKGGTVTNVGGYAGLVDQAPSGVKKTLLGG